MMLTAEISMYPLREAFTGPIDAFIEDLNRHPGMRVETSPTSTLVVGDYDRVMAAISAGIAASAVRYGTSAFVVKLLPDYDPDDRGESAAG